MYAFRCITKRYISIFLTVGLYSGLFIACQSKTETRTREQYIDRVGMDTTNSPGDDFFRYANGNWLDKTKIPDDQVSWGTFNEVYETNIDKAVTILEDAALEDAAFTRTRSDKAVQKVGDFYASGLDTNRIDALGLMPLASELATISTLTNYREALAYLITHKARFDGVLLDFQVVADDRESILNRINLVQPSLSLPVPGYYTRTDSTAVTGRRALTDYAATLFKLTGVDELSAKTKAQAVVALEKRLAQFHKMPVDLRDPAVNYHRLTVKELDRQMPNLGWRELLNTMGLQRVNVVLVAHPTYYQGLNSLLPVLSVDDLRDYLTYALLDANAALLSQPFRHARFVFRNKILAGQRKEADRRKWMANMTDQNLGDALGRLWIRRYFSPDTKASLDTLLETIRQTYRDRINELSWLSPEAKRVAARKLERLGWKIGFPDQWNDETSVVVRRDDFFGNVQRAKEDKIRIELAQVDQLADPNKWLMTPITVNAYANPANVEIVFPAGILQAPFFNKHADDAVNYGSIGTIIAHEMTHLFDDRGRQYNEFGNLRSWWSLTDSSRFRQKTQALANQLALYQADGRALDRHLLLSEGLADLGGVTLAYQAFKRTKQGQSSTRIDGLTPDQRFFLSFAQTWRFKLRSSQEKLEQSTNSHAPAPVRVNGTLANFTPFYRAFGVKEGDGLYKKERERVEVW